MVGQLTDPLPFMQLLPPLMPPHTRMLITFRLALSLSLSWLLAISFPSTEFYIVAPAFVLFSSHVNGFADIYCLKAITPAMALLLILKATMLCSAHLVRHLGTHSKNDTMVVGRRHSVFDCFAKCFTYSVIHANHLNWFGYYISGERLQLCNCSMFAGWRRSQKFNDFMKRIALSAGKYVF